VTAIDLDLPPTYRPEPGRWDALTDEGLRIRPGWHELVQLYARLGDDELGRRERLARQALLAEGASTLFHDAEDAPSRPWELDPVPVIVTGDEWAVLSRGLEQRARLLEALTADLYGHQRVLREGVVPAEVVLGYPGWQRSAVGTAPVTGPRLVLAAADVVRDEHGHWMVLRHHTDAPSGSGYALMNRVVLSRLFPDIYRELRVQRLGAWFADLREALGALAPPGRESPRTAVLTTGPTHRSYAEHGYLATYLGYHLAEGADLAVRDGRIWLRALGGLEPLDVLLRRVEDVAADPLELGAGGPGLVPGAAGVPGLLDAARRGGVGLANALGSGVAEHLGLLPYLGAVCQRLLGERLLLPSVPTRWCGEPEVLRSTLDGFDGLVLHDTAPGQPHGSVFGRLLGDEEAAAWAARLRAEPGRYVVQDEVVFASTPVLSASGLKPGSAVVRTFTISGSQGQRTLPGGIGLVTNPGVPVLAMSHGWAKDVWVPAATTDQQLRLWSRPETAGLPQIDLRGSIPSRAAEALFWVGRNAERAELAARTALVVMNRFDQSPELTVVAGGSWLTSALAVLRACTGGTGGAPLTLEEGGAVLLRSELSEALGVRSGALGDTLGHLGTSARGVPEYLSAGTWRLLGLLAPEREALPTLATAGDLFEVVDGCSRVLVALAAFSGLVQESIVRGPGWRFLDLGRRIERALRLLGTAEAALVPEPHPDVRQPLYEVVLAANESLVAYRRRYRSDHELGPLCELLLTDDTNPRALAFQLDRIREDLASLPQGPGRHRHEGLVDRATGHLLTADTGDLATAVLGRYPLLHQLLLDIRAPLLELADGLVAVWFAHLGERHALARGLA
jgi:uncharacterized circularly permuted ATP-grasp superfamily protein/uncharacterized alpha-E superfamily protein